MPHTDAATDIRRNPNIPADVNFDDVTKCDACAAAGVEWLCTYHAGFANGWNTAAIAVGAAVGSILGAGPAGVLAAGNCSRCNGRGGGGPGFQNCILCGKPPPRRD